MLYRYGRSRGPFGLSAVASLISINVAVFFLTFFFSQLIGIFGLRPITFLQRPWTLFTAMFLHVDIMHILTNMFTLYFFGDFLVRLVGERRFLLIYLLGGLIGNIFYLLFPPSPFTTAIGASGAVFALGGALAVMRPQVRVFIFPIPVPLPLWVAVVGGFIVLSFISGIAWQAHLGGLLFGAAFGFLSGGRGGR